MLNEGIDLLLSYGLIKASRVVTRWMNFKIKSDYSITQLYLLWVTKINKNESITSISSKLSMDRSTYLRTINNMKDLIELKVEKGDVRCKVPCITKKGEDLIEQWIPKLIELDKEVRKGNMDLLPFLNMLERKFAKRDK